MTGATIDSEKTSGPPSSTNSKEVKGENGLLKPKKPVPDPEPYETHQLGVFRTHISWGGSNSSLLNLKSYFTEVFTGYLPTLYRLLSDIYALAPVILVLYFMATFWIGISQAVEMSITSRMLQSLERVLNGENASHKDIARSLTLLVSWSAFSGCLDYYKNQIFFRLRSRVINHFQLMIMRVDLGRDLPTSQDETTKTSLTAEEAWEALERLSDYFQNLVSAASQIFAMIQIASDAGGPLFVLACLARPLYEQVGTISIYDAVCFAYDNNEDHIRLRALECLARDQYRQDIISGNLTEWIIQEYCKMKDRLLDTQEDDPLYLFHARQQFRTDIVGKVLKDLPLIYSAVYALLNPSRFSLSGIAIMRSSAQSLHWIFYSIIREDLGMKKKVRNLQNLYSTNEIKNTMEDGTTNYPDEKSNPDGMAFELRDIEFSYPGSESKEPSLKNVNLKIPAGSLVIFVGANGSGKSTLIRLLSRLYDPSSGSLLIDGQPSTSYRLSSLRESSVLLCQDHNVFPFSFAENIGLGYPALMDNIELVKDAAEKGGSKGFIEKLQKGFDTVLYPQIATVSQNLEHYPEHPLHKGADIFWEYIRSRAFMRMHSGNIRFLAVDEPTSALDSEGEYELFNRLLESRAGKTMIFVTHRFGYLTKHADMIVCMKDGEIAEVGKHSDLITKKGEYAKLYNIQANAFLADASDDLLYGHGSTPSDPGTDGNDQDNWDDSCDNESSN
ncbi:hypothetical protein EST38_g14308 [Candolleomyces aberdarensis]|uniref:ABC transporter domain-containing protein n=1 Tax=Candolleomyces aberdarensis TaxID=2316362 RepID=A0A4Q2CXL6_9AGAR|nr:hypothetical protein EST38_g14308 [Candolleomyces aberdarensis]